MGSEAGELASSQDEANWLRQAQSRRENTAETWIRSLVDKLIKVGVLPPVDNYGIEWDPLDQVKDKERAETAKLFAEAVGAYITSGGEALIPIEIFMGKWLGFSEDQIDEIEEIIEAREEEEELDLEKMRLDPMVQRLMDEGFQAGATQSIALGGANPAVVVEEEEVEEEK